MNISIVTINYNSSENTIKLLESLGNQTDSGFDVFVVDNASEYEELQRLKNYRTDASNIVFIENDKNLGFSGGNNVGIKQALRNDSGWILLLNNDTWVENDFIVRLKAELEGKEGLPAGRQGILGLAIDEGDKTAYAGKVSWLKPTLPHISDAKAISNFQFPISNEFSNPNSSNGKREMVNDKCFYAIGGAVAIHKDVFEKIGYLDEKYFLYFEDADFSVRARKAGIPVGFLPDIKVSHAVSSTTKKLGSPMLLYYHHRNAFYFNRKNGPWHIKILNWLWRQWVVKKQLSKIIFGINREHSRAILEGAYDYSKGKMGKHD